MHQRPHRHGPELHGDGTATFRLWAPRAERVTLELRDGSHEMAADAGGWHTLRASALPGDRYGFTLPDGKTRPDPASRRQPDGVHELSAVADLGALPFGVERWDAAPLERTVIYELHVGAFTPEGTFAAAAGRLDHLAALGVTHVEVMPVNGVNGTWNWGYDGVAWYTVHEPYGGPDGFAAFVDACHARGLGVILDVVYNHLGPSGNFLPDFAPYLTQGRSTWGDLLNLDGPDSDPVRDFIVGNALQWLRDYRCDGLRLDAVHALLDSSARHILAELADAVDALEDELGRPLVLIAESDRNDPLTITRRAEHGLGMRAQWVDDLHHAIHTAVTGERDGYYVDYDGLPDVARAYRSGFLYDGRYSVYRQRTVGAPLPDTVPGHRLVTCVQNHDQVGNRAAGERLTTLVPPELVRVAIVLLLASPTTPMLWMGEEYGETNPFQFFTSHPEQELGRAVSEGRREEFADFSSWSAADVPDPQDPETFRRSTLDWARLDSPGGRERLALWRDLLRLRRDVPALGEGRRDLVRIHRADADVLVAERRGPGGAPDGGAVLVCANIGEEPAAVPLPGEGWSLLLDSEDRAYGGANRATVVGSTLTMGPGAAALLARRALEAPRGP
ncbi:MAG TPA: malto-oligosyltrehalose trehalohydrolase [Egibacteraceae bacterium]|nr:malto-oligosyltrehalose trehalohydrolase [Egibacteraceae bacterium]